MRKIISNIALWGGMVAGGMLLASCGDRDFFNPYNKADQYAANWEQKIGAIDPNQDWSMATTVKATINVAAAGDGVLSIYTENPVHSTAKLLAKAFLDNGTGNVTFDAIKGTEQVFVIARNNGKNVVYGWADIVNGTVDAGKTVAKKAAKTRAGEYCLVTKGEVTELNIACATDHQAKYIRSGWDGSLKLFADVKAELDEEIQKAKDTGNYSNLPQIFSNKQMDYYSIVKGNGLNPWDAGYEIISCDYSNVIFFNNFTFAEKISLTMLNNVEQTAVEPWAVPWGWELFGNPGDANNPIAFFKENIRYDDSRKTSIPGYDLAKVEQGFSITTAGGEINVPFIFGATQHNNRFGYVYYKDGQDPLTQPHYILMADGRPQSNIYFNIWRSSKYEDNMGDGMKLSNWNEAGKTYFDITPETLVYGTNYKLAFFGENHDQSATYTFPAGYKIVFFIAPLNGDDYNTGEYNYSLPELNKCINHQEWKNGVQRGVVKATAWTYNGHIYMGFEDGGHDEDLNDIVFWVEGDFTPDQKVPEVPSTTQPKEEYTSWILACEDLGSTDDYDFNDIVLEVRTKIESEETFEGSAKTGETFKKATLEMRCLAAGGIYEANIHYNNTWIGESHNLLGGRVGTMINTEQLGRFSDWRTLETITDKDAWNNIGDAWSINNVANKIKIVVTIDGKTAESALIKAPDSGEAPQMITVPGDWLWPAERKDIKLAYLSFSNWNANSNDIEWYKKCESGLVIKR